MATKEEVTHTPGPWKAAEWHSDGFPFAIRTDGQSGGSLIASIWPNGDLENTEANARLIAAAPELLAALQSLMRTACRPGDDGKYDDSYDNARNMSRAAIAKATDKTS